MHTNLNYMRIDAAQWDRALSISTIDDSDYASLGANLWIGNLRARRGADAARRLAEWADATGRNTEAAMEIGALLVLVLDEGETAELDSDLIDRLGIGTEEPELYAALGDAERTIQSLQDAARTGVGFRSLLSMKINPSYDFIRDDPRFIALLEEVGLDD
jgi:hypothetical protein